MDTLVKENWGHGANNMLVPIIRHMLLLLPVAWLFLLSGNLELAWVSVPITDICACFLAILLLIKVYRRDISGLKAPLQASA